MVSHVKSKLGSVTGSTGEISGELGPIDAPVWGIVPDGTAQQGTTYEIPMTLWVTGRGLTGWLLTGNPAGVTIDSNGLVTILDTVTAQILSMTCYVENTAGSAISNTFEWELEAVHIPEPPVWIVVPPQSTPDSQLPDQLDMKDFVTSFLPITAWTTTEGTITGEGILVIPVGTPVGVLSITVTAENEDGVSPSAPFNWEITLSEDAPLWDTVPNRSIEDTDLPYQEDMNDHILEGANLTGWALSGDPAQITIDGAGLMTMAGGTPVNDYTMTCFVENAFGSDISNTFTWSVIEIIPPVWDDIPEQENDDRDHPVDLDMTQFVSSDSPLTGWTTNIGAIDGAGLLTVAFPSYNTVTITVGVTNDGGTEETSFLWSAQITAADIDTQPVSSEINEPDGTSFTVDASHPTASLLYLWQAFNSAGSWVTASTVLSDSVGGNTLTLTINSSIPEDTFLLRCRIRPNNINGASVEVFTDEVQLTVIALSQPPKWDDIPDQNTIFDDFELDVSVFVTADPPVTLYTTDLGSITNAGVLSIPFGDIDPETNFIVNLTTTNAEGTAGTAFNLIVGVPEAVVITLQPVNRTVDEPDGTTYTINGTHPHGVNNTWYASNKGGGSWSHATNRLSDVDGVFNSLEMTVNSTNPDDDDRFVRGHIRPNSTSDVDGYSTISNEVELNVNPPTTPPVITSQPSNAETIEGNSAQFTVVASHPDGADLFYLWTHNYADTSGLFSPTLTVNNADLSDDGKSCSVEVFAYAAGTGPSVISQSAELTVVPSLVPPEWGPDIPNQITEVVDMPATFDANDYVSSGELISAWSTLLGASSASGAGIISLPRRSVGSLNNDGVLATNSEGTTQSNNFNWVINPSVVLDDDFSYGAGDLEGNGPWVVIEDRGDTPTNTLLGGGGFVNGQGGLLFTLDISEVLPGGPEYEFVGTLQGSPQGAIVSDIMTLALVDAATLPELGDGATINVRRTRVTYETTGGTFELNVTNSNGQTFGMRRLSNGSFECLKDGAVRGTISSGIAPSEVGFVFLTTPINGTANLGWSDLIYTVFA